MPISFNKPGIVGAEIRALEQVASAGCLAGDGPATRACQEVLTRILEGGRVFLTHSCTAAIEMAALLLDLKPGDEVIMPSFTFPSTANPFVLRGATPVFVDIRGDTLNINERLIAAAVTPRTRAICLIHYAGLAADMQAIKEIAARHALVVIEDAAQALFSRFCGRPVGSFGQFAAFSFHDTKNIIAGEGGALVVNDPSYVARAEIMWNKGTNRADFLAGRVSKYTWVDIGSSFLPSELTAAFLLEQLRQGERVTSRRRAIWSRYHELLADLERAGRVRRPVIAEGCLGNGHTYYLLLPETVDREEILEALRVRGVSATSHYVPLHSSPAGRRFGRCHGSLQVTETSARRLLRLPIHLGLSDDDVEFVVDQVYSVLAPRLPQKPDRRLQEPAIPAGYAAPSQ